MRFYLRDYIFHGYRPLLSLFTFLTFNPLDLTSLTMADEQKQPTEDGKPFVFEYYRSPLHRYVAADGVWLGLNGFNKIILNFYNDSPPLPKKILAETTSDVSKFTSKEPVTTYETDSSTVRQFETSVTISLAAAKQLYETLGNFIKMGDDAEQRKQSPNVK